MGVADKSGMEIREAAQRIFRVRGLVILACLVAGLAAGYGIHRSLEKSTYTASARLVMSGTVPQDAGWAAALAGTVEGIATSPDRISGALADAGVTRDLVTFTKGVDTQALSDSSILELSVTDTSAAVAAAVANTLATGAVTTLNDEQQAPSNLLLSQLDAQMSTLTSAIDGIDTRLAATSPPSASGVTALLAQRGDLAQQLTALITKRADVEQQMAQSVSASVISSAAMPVLPDPSRLPLDLVLGALAGLIVGVALAVLLETLRPTLVGRDAIGQALGAPVLGVMPVTAGASADVLALSARLRHAAERAWVATAVLWNGDEDLSDVAQRLQSAKPAVRLSLTVLAAASGETALGEAAGTRSGMVVVVPPRVPLHRIEEAEAVSAGEGLVMLGAILRPRTRRRWGSRRRNQVKLTVAEEESPELEEPIVTVAEEESLQLEEAGAEASALLVS
jgi:capsular polysaccharide biosynthesis protein